MSSGLNEETLLLEKELQASGKPSLLDNRVDVPHGLEWVWRAFNRLNESRRIGGLGSINPIGFSEIVAYAQAHAMTRDEWARLDFLICAMDRAYRKWHAARSAERAASERDDGANGSERDPSARVGGRRGRK